MENSMAVPQKPKKSIHLLAVPSGQIAERPKKTPGGRMGD
jgi:hypothetical protein